ncbi:MAG: DUF4160 domain-containing protein [Thermoleophilaceae bacterium]
MHSGQGRFARSGDHSPSRSNGPRKSLCKREGGAGHSRSSYGDGEATIDIETLEVIAGELAPRARRLVSEWAREHQAELRDNWARARAHQPLRSVEPLR